MPSQKNITALKKLTEKLQQAKSIVLADYRGLPVNLQQTLRRQVKQAGGELIVAKNTLLNLALNQQKIQLPDNFKQLLEGPTITLFAYEDEISPLKALADFAKNNQLPQVKCGFLGKKPLTANQINQLAQLPSKPDMLATTIATINAPLTGFVNVLSGNLTNLIYVLQAIKTKNQKGGD